MRASTPRSTSFIYLDVYTYHSVGSLRARREGRARIRRALVSARRIPASDERTFISLHSSAWASSQEFPRFFRNFLHKFVINSTNNNERNVHLYSLSVLPTEGTQSDGNICRTVLWRAGSIARKIIGLLLCTFPPRLFMLDHLFTQSDTRFHEPIEFLSHRSDSLIISASAML